MTVRERFLKTLNFQKSEDRIPMVEWAAWWDKTMDRWIEEGMPKDLSLEESLNYFDLDVMHMLVASPTSAECPRPASHGASVITDMASYEKILPYLYTDASIEAMKKVATRLRDRHEKGDFIIRLWLDGFFWYPRTLLGIEKHLFAFYDQPELIHRINSDLSDYIIRTVEALSPILIPDMVGFAEDMSYNHGPMLSYELFKTFILPYYQKVIPTIKKYGINVLVDSDGNIETMIPWLMEAGIEGVYPLERQAGVDVNWIRENYPKFLMLGGYDKMVMTKGEAAMRAEFERLLPVMKSGGYIPSVDHQTPPGVSLAAFQTYIQLFTEYAQKAISGLI